jgi:hypothetical protein
MSTDRTGTSAPLLIGAAEAGDKRVTSRPPAVAAMMPSSWRRVFERQQGHCIVDLLFIVVFASSGTRLGAAQVKSDRSTRWAWTCSDTLFY